MNNPYASNDHLIAYCQFIVEEWFRSDFRPPFSQMLKMNDPERCPFPCLTLSPEQRIAFPQLAASIRFGEGHATFNRQTLLEILHQTQIEGVPGGAAGASEMTVAR